MKPKAIFYNIRIYVAHNYTYVGYKVDLSIPSSLKEVSQGIFNDRPRNINHRFPMIYFCLASGITEAWHGRESLVSAFNLIYYIDSSPIRDSI